MQKLCVSISLDVIARFLTDLETRRFGINKFTLVAEQRSSAMSGTTDRREEEHVPQFYGRIDEKFAEWETDVKLWQVEYKEEDRDRLGPKAVSKRSAWTAEDYCENQARYTRCVKVHSGQHHPMPQRQSLWRTS